MSAAFAPGTAAPSGGAERAAAARQTPAAAGRPSAQADTARLLAEGRKALAAGDVPKAVELADRILAQAPGVRDAAALKIDALASARDWETALTAYETFAAAIGKEDGLLLRPIARAVLAEIAAFDGGLATPALERLACGGDQEARRTLLEADRGQAPLQRRTLDRVVARARLGDQGALAALTAAAESGSRGGRLAAFQALRELPAPGLDDLVGRALRDEDPSIRLAAVELARVKRLKGARDQLRALLDDRVFLLRIQAAAALLAIGDTAGHALLTSALASEFADARLAAARGLAAGNDRSWMPVARALLDNRDGLFRLQAAALLLTAERPAALRVLREGVADPNPTVRLEAARILASEAEPDLALLRPLLRDLSPWVRLEAAAALQGPAVACAS